MTDGDGMDEWLFFLVCVVYTIVMVTGIYIFVTFLPT